MLRIYFSYELIGVNLVFNLAPSPFTIAMIASEILAAISACIEIGDRASQQPRQASLHLRYFYPQIGQLLYPAAMPGFRR